MTPEGYDVIVVGFGPVGQVAANLLGQRNFRVAVFETATAIYNLPRAAHFDAEIMRVFQSVGLAEAVLPACAEVRGMDFLNADGERLFGFTAPQRLTVNGWPAGYMFYQPDLERALRRGVQRFPNVEVFTGHEVLSIEQTADQVTVRVRDLASGEERTVSAEWLWGCDGARSLARKTAGIELEDLEFDQPWLVIDTMLKGNVELPEFAQQICDPSRPTTFIPSAGRHRRWEFMLLPGEEPAEMERTENVWRLLRAWVTPDDTEVIRAVVYSFHALIARSYRDRRVFILGDAAHQMPPFLGQGMCAGIRDAANLVWKLDFVRGGLATDALLDTYFEERAPHVREIITRAVTAGRIIQTTDPNVAASRDAAFLANPQRVITIGDGEDGPIQAQMPPLKSGLFSGDPPAGTMAPQPVALRNGTPVRLDELLGEGFAIVAGEGARDILTPRALDAWSAFSPTVVQVTECREPQPWLTASDPDGQLALWLTRNLCAVVRPDRYVYGVATAAEELAALAAMLREQLQQR
jgi:3-(3-hydroxy-phenyl)propionate hydroxylase